MAAPRFTDPIKPWRDQSKRHRPHTGVFTTDGAYGRPPFKDPIVPVERVLLAADELGYDVLHNTTLKVKDDWLGITRHVYSSWWWRKRDDRPDFYEWQTGWPTNWGMINAMLRAAKRPELVRP